MSGAPTSGVPATSAYMNTVLGVWADGAGGFYIADSSNNAVRFVSSSGIITTVAGMFQQLR